MSPIYSVMHIRSTTLSPLARNYNALNRTQVVVQLIACWCLPADFSLPPAALLVAEHVQRHKGVCGCLHPRNASHRLPTVLLNSLLIDIRPWSHIVQDFNTGLPPFSGNIVLNY